MAPEQRSSATTTAAGATPAAAAGVALAVPPGERGGRLHLGFAAVLLSALYASALLTTQATAREASSRPGSECGQTRWVLVRFIDGTPAVGVQVGLTAASTDLGVPEVYKTNIPEGQSTAMGANQGILPTPRPRPRLADCRPVITGTMTAITDSRGRARFDRLGEGVWVAWFEGKLTHEGRTASVVPAPVQGLFPQGRTRRGGGFLEQVTALNEEGGPSEEPVQPGAGPTTSRYVMEFSTEYAGWLPGVDLATGDDAPPRPLAGVPVTAAINAATPATPEPAFAGITQATSTGLNAESAASSTTQESYFDPDSAQVESGPRRTGSQPGGQNGARWFNIWWVAALGLALGGALALVRARTRPPEAGAAEPERTRSADHEGGE